MIVNVYFVILNMEDTPNNLSELEVLYFRRFHNLLSGELSGNYQKKLFNNLIVPFGIKGKLNSLEFYQEVYNLQITFANQCDFPIEAIKFAKKNFNLLKTKHNLDNKKN